MKALTNAARLSLKVNILGMDFEIFQKHPLVKLGISKKKHGTLKKFSGNFNAEEILRKNEKIFLTEEGIKNAKVYALKQVHGNKILHTDNIANNATFFADALVTDKPGEFLTISVADCYPIYIYDPSKKVIALAHAGWRGITKDILCNVIDYFVLKFSSNPKDILVGVGPGLKKCHFEVNPHTKVFGVGVKENILDNFIEYPDAIEERDGKIFIDLPSILGKKMLERGLKKENINFSNLCTYCEDELFFSRRRDKNSEEVMMAYIGMF